MLLPEEFISYTRQTMGDERFRRYQESFGEEPPVSIRLNPQKTEGMTVDGGEAVPWCRNGYYLPRRPQFTMDPLLHAGCYYVQEAASMFLDEVLRQHLPPHPLTALDLCAAPGGKSTLLAAALPKGSTLFSNEPVRQRANILLENVTKWGYPNHVVTNCYPRDYRASKLRFDVILCDVPCSGEGMFRKDESTIREWSPQQVEKCWQLQRDIVSDAWSCLNNGGLLIYSTCTFNTKENEENVRWFCETFDDAQMLTVDVKPEWHITGSLLKGFDAPVYRFIPGITRSEGLFMCVMRKRGERDIRDTRCEVRGTRLPSSAVLSAKELFSYLAPRTSHLEKEGASKKNVPRTSHLDNSELPCADLTYPQALAYLRGEALQLPADTPRGIVTVAFMGHPLGQVKNIGTRANNLYPKEWRIKTTHIPTDYEAILRHT